MRAILVIPFRLFIYLLPLGVVLSSCKPLGLDQPHVDAVSATTKSSDQYTIQPQDLNHVEPVHENQLLAAQSWAIQLMEQSFTAHNGEQVRFFQADNAWWADVQPSWMSDRNKRELLPIHLGAGMALQQLLKFNEFWQKRRLHVIGSKNKSINVSKPVLLYVGSMGLCGGGNGVCKYSPDDAKWDSSRGRWMCPEFNHPMSEPPRIERERREEQRREEQRREEQRREEERRREERRREEQRRKEALKREEALIKEEIRQKAGERAERQQKILEKQEQRKKRQEEKRRQEEALLREQEKARKQAEEAKKREEEERERWEFVHTQKFEQSIAKDLQNAEEKLEALENKAAQLSAKEEVSDELSQAIKAAIEQKEVLERWAYLCPVKEKTADEFEAAIMAEIEQNIEAAFEHYNFGKGIEQFE